jgi:hypothetical protein
VQEPLILGQYTQHELPLDYATVNTLNGIKWKLDQDVLAEPEVYPCENGDAQARKNAANHVAQARKLYQELGEKPFHLAWQYDSRGRIYSHGYHVNLQSYEYKKASLSFAKQEYLT